MTLPRQRTIQRQVTMEGVALHAGKRVRMVLRPAPEGAGICFIREDLPGRPVIPARADRVGQTIRCTALGEPEGAMVQTVEHFMAAVFALGIDNLEVGIDGPELPVGDGSAAAFVALLEEAGVQEQDALRQYRQVEKPLWTKRGDSLLIALPADEFRISFTFVSDHPVVGDQFLELVIETETFVREIAPARTLAFWEEIETLQRKGLGLGGDLEKVVVVKDNGYLGPLRFPDEVVRHKVLDLVGDLALVGPLKGHVIAIRGGHAVNNQLARLLLQERPNPKRN